MPTIKWVKTHKKIQIAKIASCSSIETNSFYIATLRLIFIMGEPHRQGFLVGLKVSSLENENHETCIGRPFFSQKMLVKTEKNESSPNVESVWFFIYLYHTNHLLENENHKTSFLT